MQLKDVTILQISPATGFNAVFAEDDATVYTRPVACWTLIRRTLVLGDGDWKKIDDLNIPVPDEIDADHEDPIPITRVEGMVSSGGHELSPARIMIISWDTSGRVKTRLISRTRPGN